MDVLVFSQGQPVRKVEAALDATVIGAQPIVYAAHDGRVYAVTGPWRWQDLTKAIGTHHPKPWKPEYAAH